MLVVVVILGSSPVEGLLLNVVDSDAVVGAYFMIPPQSLAT
jgi:hypothetical protein